MFENINETKAPVDEEGLHYYYNRNDRIKKAPKIVQDYYNGKMKPEKGIKVLFNKNNRYIFLALIFFVGAYYVYSGLSRTKSYAKINEIDCEIQAFVYEEQVFISSSFKRNPKSKKTAPADISIEFSIVDVDKQVVHKEVQSLLYKDGEQFLRTKFYDYDIIRVDALVTVDGESKEITCQVKR